MVGGRWRINYTKENICSGIPTQHWKFMLVIILPLACRYCHIWLRTASFNRKTHYQLLVPLSLHPFFTLVPSVFVPLDQRSRQASMRIKGRRLEVRDCPFFSFIDWLIGLFINLLSYFPLWLVSVSLFLVCRQCLPFPCLKIDLLDCECFPWTPPFWNVHYKHAQWILGRDPFIQNSHHS